MPVAVEFVNRRFVESRSVNVISCGRDIPIFGIDDIVAEPFNGVLREWRSMFEFVSLISLLKSRPHVAGAQRFGEPGCVSPRFRSIRENIRGLTHPGSPIWLQVGVPPRFVVWRAITVAVLIALPSSSARAEQNSFVRRLSRC